MNQEMVPRAQFDEMARLAEDSQKEAKKMLALLKESKEIIGKYAMMTSGAQNLCHEWQRRYHELDCTRGMFWGIFDRVSDKFTGKSKKA